MKKFTLEFKMDAGFDENPEFEIIKILSRISARLEDGQTFGNIADINGNVIGTWEIDQ